MNASAQSGAERLGYKHGRAGDPFISLMRHKAAYERGYTKGSFDKDRRAALVKRKLAPAS